jgi:hypothetical protein
VPTDPLTLQRSQLLPQEELQHTPSAQRPERQLTAQGWPLSRPQLPLPSHELPPAQAFVGTLSSTPRPMFTQVPPAPVQALQVAQLETAQQWLSTHPTEHCRSALHEAPLASLQSMSCGEAPQVVPHAVQPLGQKPSEVALHGRGVEVHLNVQAETVPVRVLIVFASLTQVSNWVWQDETGSQVSPVSIAPFPHDGTQLLSLFALQVPPVGQQASPFVQAVMRPAFTHSVVQPEPCSMRSWQATAGQLAGQFAPSHFSPHAGSVTPLPQTQPQSLSVRLVQPLAQQPSPFVHVAMTVSFTHSALHAPAVPCSFRFWQPTGAQLAGQLPSHFSPASTAPLPHLGVQSLSLFALHVGGQQPSPGVQTVCVPSSTQAAVQAAELPVSFFFMHAVHGHVVGQLEGGSHFSPASTAPLPHFGTQSLSVLALQAGGQQPSPSVQALMSVSSTQRAWQVPPLTSRRVWHAMGGQLAGQLLFGSQVSWQAASIRLLPQAHWQSVSFALVQPGGQQPSPEAHAVCMPSSTQRAVQVAAVPVSFCFVHPIGGQLVGQLLGGSQVSPASVAPLPQAGLQSLSFVALQPEGQQPSPPTHAVCVPLSTHWAWQVPGLASLRSVQPMGGHDVGHFPSGSQVS